VTPCVLLQARGERRQLFGAAGDQHQIVAAAGEPVGIDGADAIGCAGNEKCVGCSCPCPSRGWVRAGGVRRRSRVWVYQAVDEIEKVSVEAVLMGLRQSMVGACIDLQHGMLDDLDGGKRADA
jgi:hypothetical protein